MGLSERSKLINTARKVDIDLIVNAVRPQMLNYQTQGTDDLKGLLRLEVRKYLEQNFPHYLDNLYSIAEEVYNKMYMLGPFEKYLKMDGVTDIISFGTRLMYIKDGVKYDDEKGFANMEEVRIIYERIIANSGQNISYAEPSKDAELYDGSRVKVIIPPEALEPYIIIRKHTSLNKSLDELVYGLRGLNDSTGTIEMVKKRTKEEETFNGTLSEYFKMCVRNRRNFVIIGETGAGKTTFVNALTYYIQPKHIVAVLEDTREMELPLPYVFYLKTREEKEGAKAITYEDILYDCLRANPDRIILTEIRTPISAYTFINVLNSGHRGSFTTIHADNVEMALDKLEMLIKEFKNIDDRTIRRLISKAIDVLVFIGLEEDEKGDIIGRAVKEVAELKGIDEKGNYILNYKYIRW